MIVNFADQYPGNGSDNTGFSVRDSGRKAPEKKLLALNINSDFLDQLSKKYG